MDGAMDLLLALGSSPWAIAFTIVLATFVLEDAATVAAALLASSGEIGVGLAVGALVVGVFAGDLGLYGLGAAARTRSWAKAIVSDERIARGGAWLKHRLAGALIGARFLPGFRLPVYTASGFLAVPFRSFVAITAVASVVWTAFAFSLVFMFGSIVLDELGPWKWAFGVGLLLAVIVGPAAARRFAERPADV